MSEKFERGFPARPACRSLSPVWQLARWILHTYSLGHERTKGNREFEKPLVPALSLAAGDLGPLMAPLLPWPSPSGGLPLALELNHLAKSSIPQLSAPEQFGPCLIYPTETVIVRYYHHSPMRAAPH
jgi:hypothetical protein